MLLAELLFGGEMVVSVASQTEVVGGWSAAVRAELDVIDSRIARDSQRWPLVAMVWTKCKSACKNRSCSLIVLDGIGRPARALRSIAEINRDVYGGRGVRWDQREG